MRTSDARRLSANSTTVSDVCCQESACCVVQLRDEMRSCVSSTIGICPCPQHQSMNMHDRRTPSRIRPWQRDGTIIEMYAQTCVHVHLLRLFSSTKSEHCGRWLGVRRLYSSHAHVNLLTTSCMCARSASTVLIRIMSRDTCARASHFYRRETTDALPHARAATVESVIELKFEAAHASHAL